MSDTSISNAVSVADLVEQELRELDAHAAPEEPHDRLSVAVLAASARQLQGVVRELRERAVRFWNPHSFARGDWNPLRTGHRPITALFGAGLLGESEDGFRLWTWKELARWIEVCSVNGLLRRGAKTNLVAERAAKAPSIETDPADLDRVFADWPKVRAELLPMLRDPAAESRALAWLAGRATSTASRALEYPLALARTNGVRSLLESPRVVVGTLHSVKGATFGSVLLSPDLAGGHAREWEEGGAGRDQIVHLMYVGMTRSASRLLLLSNSRRNRRPVPGVDW